LAGWRSATQAAASSSRLKKRLKPAVTYTKLEGGKKGYGERGGSKSGWGEFD
jgi:hypothetical protein